MALNPNGGNVGIGTTAAQNTFTIINSTANYNVGADNDPASGQLLIRNTKSGTSPYSLAIGMDQTLGIAYINAAGNSAAQSISLNPRGGNVGINTINPVTALDVSGHVRINSSKIYTLTAQATAANATNTTVALMDINNNGTYLVSVYGIGGGFVNVSGLALVAFYYDGASNRYANMNSISVVNFSWGSITASTGTITFQQTSGYGGVVCTFNALRLS